MSIVTKFKDVNVLVDGKLDFSHKSWSGVASPAKRVISVFAEEFADRYDTKALAKRIRYTCDNFYKTKTAGAMVWDALKDTTEFINRYLPPDLQLEINMWKESHDVYGNNVRTFWITTVQDKKPVYWIDFGAKGTPTVDYRDGRVENFFRRLVRKPTMPIYRFEVAQYVRILNEVGDWMEANIMKSVYRCRSTSCIDKAIELVGRDYTIPISYIKKYQEEIYERRKQFFANGATAAH